MPLATDFLNSNYFAAEDLDPKVLIETAIVSVRPREFEDGERKLVVYTDHQGKGVVLNQTRLKTMIAGFGPNFDGWVGKQIIISQGSTMYSGEPVPAIVVQPVVPTRIAAERRPALEASSPRPIQTTRGPITPGSVDIRSGRYAQSDAPPSAPPPDVCPDGPGDPSDDIPF
jgi:hypothetical protein